MKKIVFRYYNGYVSGVICLCFILLSSCNKTEDTTNCRKIPISIKTSGTLGTSLLSLFEYDDNNRLVNINAVDIENPLNVMNNNVPRISYNSSGDVDKAVYCGFDNFHLPANVSYFRDSFVYVFSRKDKIITCNITEYFDSEIFDQYTETITLNDLELPGRIEKINGSFYTYLYDTKGNLISAKHGHVGLQGEEINYSYTYDNKNGMFSQVNTSKWWLVFSGYTDICNNRVTIVEEDTESPPIKFNNIYDKCNYIKSVQITDVNIFDVEYKEL